VYTSGQYLHHTTSNEQGLALVEIKNKTVAEDRTS